MEPYKFEQDIKNKLEKRTIKPTENSWDKLQNSLEFKARKKGTKVWYLIGVAASIVGVLFMVSIFFNKDIEQTTPTVVDAPIIQKEDSSGSVATKNNSTVLDTLQNSESVNNTINIIAGTSKKTNSKSKNHSDFKFVDVKKTTPDNENIVRDVTDLNVKKDSIYGSVEDTKIEVILTQIRDLKTKTYVITDKDIDALLRDAQLAIEFEKLYEENTKTVDAYKLLQDVEADIDKSIRVKFLETLKLNYENMKTLIAQRND